MGSIFSLLWSSESNPDRLSLTLFLDPAIRDWVVLPLFVIMVIAGMLRGLMGQYLASPYEKSKSIVGITCQHNLNHWMHSIRSGSAHYISTTRWYIRRLSVLQQLNDRAEYCLEQHEKKKALEEKDGGVDDDTLAAMTNPMSMMKGNMAFMVQNMVMMQGIQYFFSGFVMLKIPFALTSGFKAMFQKGLADVMPDLDSSYVSSISWYFLTMYGLRGFFRIAMGGEPPLEFLEQERTLQQQLGFAPPPMEPRNKHNSWEEWATKFQKEAENVELFLTAHHSDLDLVEKRLLGNKYPKRKSNPNNKQNSQAAVSNSDILLGIGKRKTQ